MVIMIMMIMMMMMMTSEAAANTGRGLNRNMSPAANLHLSEAAQTPRHTCTGVKIQRNNEINTAF
jgi:hypothetical protein